MPAIKQLMLLGVVGLSLLCGYAQADDFADFAADFQQEFDSFKQQADEEYQNYAAQYRQELLDFKNNVASKWGYAEVSTKHKAVVYSDDLQEKLVVDFDSQQVLVEQAVGSKKSAEQVASWVEKKLLEPIGQAKQQSLQQHAAKTSLADALAVPANQVPKLAEQVIASQQPREAENAIGETIASLHQEKQQLREYLKSTEAARQQSRDATEQAKLDEELELTRQNIQDREQEQQKYQKALAKLKTDPAAKQVRSHRLNVESQRWQRSSSYRSLVSSAALDTELPEQLIYAIMETESSFNPMAVSPIPAFGLMQIVPNSAGIDVNQHLNKSKKAPSKDQLFTPDLNVTFGSTYLHILYYRYLSSITDPKSRLYCTIAAYNTGAGNVAKTFNGSSMRIKEAAVKINRMSSAQVYQTLVKRLPYTETRKYLKKVTKAMTYYEQQVSQI